MVLVHNEVHLGELLVSHPRSRWGPLLVKSCPWVQVGAIAVMSCPQSPSFPGRWLDQGRMGLLSTVVWWCEQCVK